MQEIDLSGMEQNFKNLAKSIAQLEEEMNRMRENAEKDMEKINAKYAEYYQSIPKNIKIDTEIAALKTAKVINSTNLNQAMLNMLAKKPEEELQEIGKRMGIYQEKIVPEEEAVVATTEEAILNSQAENNLENSLIAIDNQEETDELHELFPEGTEEEIDEEESIEEYQEENPLEQPQEKKKGSFLSRILKR